MIIDMPSILNLEQLLAPKQPYQTPTLERHDLFLGVTGNTLPIGTIVNPLNGVSQ